MGQLGEIDNWWVIYNIEDPDINTIIQTEESLTARISIIINGLETFSRSI